MTKKGMWLCTRKQAEDNGFVGSTHSHIVACHCKRLVRFNFHKVYISGPSKSRQVQHGLGLFLHQCTSKCLHLFRLSFSCPFSGVSDMFSTSHGHVKAKWSKWSPVFLGNTQFLQLLEFLGVGASETLLGEGRVSEICSLPMGPVPLGQGWTWFRLGFLSLKNKTKI